MALALAPFIAPVLTAIRWATTSALPLILTSWVAGFLLKVGIGITAFSVIYTKADIISQFSIDSINDVSGGLNGTGDSVLSLLALFGIFEGISLIASCLLAKAAWVALKPTLTFLNPPA